MKIDSKIHKHICKYGHNHVHKIVRYAHDFHHAWLHVGELVLISFMSLFTFILASGSGLPNNVDFEYPLKKVSTLECRTLYWDEMPDNCKINLPIIHGANYIKYQDSPGYKDIYTTLWASAYSDGWDNKIGAHAGVDIATARGTPLYSIGNGKVYFAGWNSAYGNVVKIKYLYRGEYIYVIYAHMDTIEIEQGKTVAKGQRIGTVGNSGNTFGVLGGYHVHFQVAKDAGGRPKYSYLDCPDLSKGHYKIIQEGLCREQLFANEYDPIKLLEQNYSPPVLVNDTTSHNTVIEGISPSNTNPVVDIKPNIGPVVDTKPDIVPNVLPDDEEDKGDVVENDFVEVVANQEIKRENLILDTSTLDLYSQHFWNQNEIWIESDLVSRNLKLGEEGLIIININKKSPTEKYNGILNIPFSLISTNTNVTLNLSNIKLVDNGTVEIKIKGNSVGPSTVLINFGGKKIGKLSLNVVN